MEFSKAYEYFKKHFGSIRIVLLDGQAWITDGHVLLQAENVPEGFCTNAHLLNWECPGTCSEAPTECEYNAACCSSYADGYCDETANCLKDARTCGRGVFVASEWKQGNLKPEAISRLLEACPTTEIKPDKNKTVAGKTMKMFTPQGTIVDMKIFALLRGSDFKYYQVDNNPCKEIYVKDRNKKTIGILMPRRI